KPIQRDHDHRQAEVFKKITAPLILRRLKSDRSVIADLPDKIENNQYATLTPEQADLYGDVARMGMEQIFEEKDESRRQELVLKMMPELRQVCNHPHLFLKSGDKLPERSGKAALLFSLLDNIYENGEKTLVLTQSQETGELLSEMISGRFAKAPLFLHDDTGRLQRDNMVAAFETGPDFDTLILCLKTGSASLNLTAAAHAIHFNGWWRPAPGSQAADRPNRIVPPQNLMAWRLLTQGTFEEKIDEMIRTKKDGANLTATTVENWIAKLSNEDLRLLVALG
ncbi:MAG: DEAD/DEAH box helicase, partial [Bacteroidetes bacterium]|nr:DEAD/DEAH box helicase [Bacteroidota bacterium]